MCKPVTVSLVRRSPKWKFLEPPLRGILILLLWTKTRISGNSNSDSASPIVREPRTFFFSEVTAVNDIRQRNYAADKHQNQPAENTKYEVEYEERADDDETDEVDPRPAVSQRVINLRTIQHHET